MRRRYSLPRGLRRKKKKRVCYYRRVEDIGRLKQTLEVEGLTELVVTGVGDVAFEGEEIATAMRQANTLKSLCLHDVNISRPSLLSLLSLIQEMPNIRKLALVKTKLPSDGVDTVLVFLEANDELVDVRFERIEYVPEQWNAPFASMVQKNTALTTLHLNHTILGEHFQGLASSLTQNVTIKRLELENCGIGPAGAKEFADALSKNVALRNVKLDRNSIGILGATSIASALCANKKITHLSLARASIPAEGIILLAAAVQTHKSLVFINLLDNHVTEEAARAILQAVHSNRNICHPPVVPPEEQTLKELLTAVQQNSLTKREAFQSAAETENKAPWGRCKLMVIGEGKAGKTATIRSLMQKKFVEQWESTAGVDILPAKALSGFKWEVDEETDFAMEMINKLAAMRFENSQSQSQSTTPASSQIQPRSSAQESSSPQPTNPFTPPTAKRSSFAECVESYNYSEELFNDAQADLSTIKLLIWDMGGQSAFHCLHHLFMSVHGIYLLIFNLKRVAEGSAEAEHHLRFWRDALALYAPGAPLVIAGTFSSEVDLRGLVQCESTIAPIFEPLESLVKIQPTSFYPIDNRTLAGTAFLREAMHRAVRKQEQPRVEVPLLWLRCLEVISAMQQRLLMIDTVEELAEKHAGLGKKEVLQMLRFFHQLGVILFFSNSSALRGIITIHPQWLMDELVKVVRDHDVHLYDNHDLRQKGLEKDLETFRQDAIISRDLLVYFWGSRANFLIELMRSLLLLSSWNFKSLPDEFYLIPSMVPKRPAVVTANSGPYGATFALRFDFIPAGVFERIVCLCVQYSAHLKSESEPLLNATTCELEFNRFGRLALLLQGQEIHCQVHKKIAARHFLAVMQAMLKKVNAEFIGNALKWQVCCWIDGVEDPVSLEQARKLNRAVWDSRDQSSPSSSRLSRSSLYRPEEEDGEERFNDFLSNF